MSVLEMWRSVEMLTSRLSYWGQDGANSQHSLGFYCQDDTVDVIPLAFLYIFRGKGSEPVIDFANVRLALVRDMQFAGN